MTGQTDKSAAARGAYQDVLIDELVDHHGREDWACLPRLGGPLHIHLQIPLMLPQDALQVCHKLS